MGGSGERFGDAIPKQFHRISGKKVYLHTLERFICMGLFDEIIVVCHKDHIGMVRNDIYKHKNVVVIAGGKTRQESSFTGLCACHNGTEFVVIHDGVRPFVTNDIIVRNVKAVIDHKAVDTCVPSADTIVCINENRNIQTIPNRRYYVRGQTPQSFHYPLIMRAHSNAIANGIANISDDCKLVVALGDSIHIVDGEESNIKITTELDLFIAEQIFRISTKSIEQGYGSLRGKKFIVTGGTSGIGEELCRMLSSEGAEPIPVARGSANNPVDLRNLREIRAFFEAIGEVDGLINSAGYFTKAPLNIMDDDVIDNTLSVNLRGLIYCCKYAKVRAGGHIVNIASSSFSRGRPTYAVYSCTKAAVVNLTQALAEELPKLCINVVIPQRTKTPMRRRVFGDEDDETLLLSEDVGEAIIDILKQKMLTGEIIEVRNKKRLAKS